MNQRIEILPGVYLRCMQSSKFKTGCFSLNIVRPLCREEAAKNALIPSVLLRGTQQHPSIASISRYLDELYGASVGTLVRKKGELQLTGLYADYIEDALVSEPIFQKTAEFVGELLFCPLTQGESFLAEAFGGEKQNLINTIRSSINDKRAYAMQQMCKAMFPNEPYGIPRIGEEQDLEDVTAHSLYRHYRSILAQSQIEIFYMGRQDEQTVSRIFRTVLSPLPRGTIQTFRSTVFDAQVQEKTVIESMELLQSKLCMGLRARHAENQAELAAVMVCNILYGAGSNCKLFCKVREEQSLCYYAGSSYDRFKDIVIVAAGISADKYTQAKTEILRQLALCAEGGFTDDELQTAKRQLISALRTMLDAPARLDEFYIGRALTDDCSSVEDLIAATGRVTAEQVKSAAASMRLDTVYFLKGEQSCSK